MELIENETREPFEGKNPQARIAAEGIIGEQLALELKSGLLGREQNQRWPIRQRLQGGADFRQAAESLATAGGAKEKPDLHDAIFSRMSAGGKNFISFPNENTSVPLYLQLPQRNCYPELPYGIKEIVTTIIAIFAGRC
jgi:hypothetical protein